VVLRVSEITTVDQLISWLAVRNELEPDEPLSMDQLEERRAAEPARRELIAEDDADVVAIGIVGPKGSPPDLAYGYLGVRDGWKRQGVEASILNKVREIARDLGRARLEVWVREDDSDLTAHLRAQGFHEIMREGGLARDLPGAPWAVSVLPHGITLEPVTSRFEFGDGAYDVAAETWPDIPGETGVEPRDVWMRLHVASASAGAFVALHEGRVVAFAGLHELGGQGLYEHGLLAVLPQFRRVGVARALKVAQLEWLRDHGARRVVTWNAETNVAARALNIALGYAPLPSSIAFQGPV
jgi:GNAT superfamily N-acetyltransferase